MGSWKRAPEDGNRVLNYREAAHELAAYVKDIRQTLNMWKGEITSHFTLNGNTFDVQTVCHPDQDMISASVTSRAHAGVNLRFPYPTGAHADDACNWDANDKHSTTIVRQGCPKCRAEEACAR